MKSIKIQEYDYTPSGDWGVRLWIDGEQYPQDFCSIGDAAIEALKLLDIEVEELDADVTYDFGECV